WNFAQAFPRSTSSLLTVLIDAPVIRVIARRLFPSVIIATICARLAVLSLFILNIMLESTIGVHRKIVEPALYCGPSGWGGVGFGSRGSDRGVLFGGGTPALPLVRRKEPSVIKLVPSALERACTKGRDGICPPQLFPLVTVPLVLIQCNAGLVRGKLWVQ